MDLILIFIIVGAVNIALVISILAIRREAERLRIMQQAQIRLMSELAKVQGVPSDTVRTILADLNTDLKK